jgi:hypothetical protein
MDDTAFLSLEGNYLLSNIAIYGSGIENRDMTAKISGVKINTIAFYQDFLSTVSFEDVVLGNITFENNLSATFECIDSEIERVRPLRSGENTTLTFVNVNSQLSDFSEINNNITINILYRVTVLVYLNLQPQEAKVKIMDEYNREWEGITYNGEKSFDLHSWSIMGGKTMYFQNYRVSASYLGFSETKDVVIANSKSVVFIWSDTQPPEITNISCKPYSWNMGQDIRIRVKIMDSGVISIAYVNLTYRIDSGALKEISMFKIEEHIYEATIPGQRKKCEITYHISAQDMAGNLNVTDPKSITVGEEENLLFLGSLVILVILISVFIMKKTVEYRKLKKYTHRYRVKGDSK